MFYALSNKSAGHTADVMTLGPQYEKRCQDEDDNGNGYYDDPFHGKLVAGGPGFVILPALPLPACEEKSAERGSMPRI